MSPGGYFLSAALGSLTLEVSAGRTGYAPTCYPGQPVITEAQRATLAVGQELPEIDFAHALERRRARATSVSIEEGTSKSIELTLSR